MAKQSRAGLGAAFAEERASLSEAHRLMTDALAILDLTSATAAAATLDLALHKLDQAIRG